MGPKTKASCQTLVQVAEGFPNSHLAGHQRPGSVFIDRGAKFTRLSGSGTKVGRQGQRSPGPIGELPVGISDEWAPGGAAFGDGSKRIPARVDQGP
jgi:hypothetical protein